MTAATPGLDTILMRHVAEIAMGSTAMEPVARAFLASASAARSRCSGSASRGVSIAARWAGGPRAASRWSWRRR